MSIRSSLLGLLPLSVLIGSSVIVQSTAFEDKKPTCDKYVLNTYLYLTIALSMIITFVIFLNVLFPNYTNFIASSMMAFIITFLINVILLFYLRYLIITVSPLEVQKKTAIWIGFILNMAFLILPTIQITILQKYTGLILSAILLTLLLTTSLSGIAFYKPELIQTQSWKPYIGIALIGLILGYLIPFFVCMVKNCKDSFLNSLMYYLAIIGVILFSFLLLYRTKIIIENAEKCKTPENADYIKESTGLFVTIINIFLDILTILKGKKGMRRLK